MATATARAVGDSSFHAYGWLPQRTSETSRSGACSPSANPSLAPHEEPAKCARSMPSALRTATASPTRVGSAYARGSRGLSLPPDRGDPRRSAGTHRSTLERGATPSQPRADPRSRYRRGWAGPGLPRPRSTCGRRPWGSSRAASALPRSGRASTYTRMPRQGRSSSAIADCVRDPASSRSIVYFAAFTSSRCRC